MEGRSLLPTNIPRSKRKNTNIMPEERDWRDLPPELIFLISQKLTHLCYFIRFRAVCKTWRSSVPLSDHPPPIPWLLEYDGNIVKKPCLKEELHFYSLASRGTKTESIPINESHRGKMYYRPAHGYLLIEDDHKLSVLNPLTNKAISFPLVPYNLRILWPVFGTSDLIPNWHLLLSVQNWTFGVYHPHEMQWKYVDSHVVCACNWNGMLFTTWGTFCTRVFDATSGKKLYEIPPPKNQDPKVLRTYLVVSCEVILRVSFYYTRFVDTAIFQIYMLNVGGKGEPCWVEVRNIGDQILFLDLWSGFSVRATAGLKENCIYFILTNGRELDRCNTLWRYDIATGKVEIVPCPFERFMWFIPNLC